MEPSITGKINKIFEKIYIKIVIDNLEFKTHNNTLADLS